MGVSALASFLPKTPRAISFRMDLLAVQGTLKNLLQHHGSKASMVSKYYSPIKNTRALQEMIDSRAGPGEIQDEPRISCGARKQESTNE